MRQGRRPSSYATSHQLPKVVGPGVVFGVRPEDVEVRDVSSADSLTARVERREALGAEILVHLSPVDAEGNNAIVVNDSGAVVARPTMLVAKMGPRSGVSVGDHLHVRLNPDHFHFFDADSGLTGGLLISCYQPNQLWRWTVETGLELVVNEWTGELILSPTNVAFYGEGLDRLALASLCGHNIVTIAPEQPGAPIRLPGLERHG